MAKEIIATTEAPQAIGPYSQGVRAGNLVFFSGQIALHPGTGEMVGDDVEEKLAALEKEDRIEKLLADLKQRRGVA